MPEQLNVGLIGLGVMGQRMLARLAQHPRLRATRVWDADPAAARAAFNSAPFTALERERWQRHPAFLLNPETGK